MIKDSKILVVDDEYANVFLLRKLLESEYTVEVSNSGTDALELVKEFKPDLILLDIMMPGISGIEVCKTLKETPDHKDIPVIMVTAKTNEESIEEGLDSGAVDYIKKPFIEVELKARIRSALKLRYLIKELKKSNDEKQGVIVELKDALSKVKTLSGLLPICSHCKKIRNDGGYWQSVEEYIRNHSDTEFTHSLCPDCARELYPDLYTDEE